MPIFVVIDKEGNVILPPSNLPKSATEETNKRIDYFNTINKYLDDDKVIKMMYNYFKNIPDIDKFHTISKPTTEYQKNIQDGNVSVPELWLKHFINQNINSNEIELLGKETFDLFQQWATTHKFKYEINSVKLGVHLSNLKINGIKKGKHTNKGDTRIYNIPELKAHFNIY